MITVQLNHSTFCVKVGKKTWFTLNDISNDQDSSFFVYEWRNTNCVLNETICALFLTHVPVLHLSLVVALNSQV